MSNVLVELRFKVHRGFFPENQQLHAYSTDITERKRAEESLLNIASSGSSAVRSG
jgi:hypothetical protein